VNLLLAGATGLIGQAVAQQWAGPGTLHRLVRRPVPRVGAHEQVHVVDFSALPGPRGLPPCSAALCALGTTIALAGSQAAFRAVDFDAVLHFARAAQAAGATRLAVVSALGADARSPSFYSRTKGEMEAAVRALGFATLLIARPSLLTGDRQALGQPQRRAEHLAMRLSAPFTGLVPAAWRPIPAATVARALLHALKHGASGEQVLDNAALHRLGEPR
jgi:uncharacterized protein YbjT (DUF2867 family)